MRGNCFECIIKLLELKFNIERSFVIERIDFRNMI